MIEKPYNTLHKRRANIIYCAFCALYVFIGVILYNLHFVTLEIAALYSVTSSVLCIACAAHITSKERSWLFWFTIIYFLFYPFGTIVGTLLQGFDSSLVNYVTTFSNNLSEDSVKRAYIVSGVCIALVWSLSPFVDTEIKIKHRKFDRDTYQMGWVILIFTSPILIFDLISQYQLIASRSYEFLYTSGFQSETSQVPGLWLISNFNTMGFLLLFSSMPSINRFRFVALIFVIISLLDSLKGSRSALLVPLIFLLWHSSCYYGFRFRFRYWAGFVATAFFFIGYWQFSRSAFDYFTLERLAQFFIADISRAQNTLAVMLDKYDSLSVGGIFAFEPIFFPLQFLEHGSAVVGQSETTAALRHDLNHTFSSQLNYGAYLRGAGLGSAFAAEAFQFGFLSMASLIPLWLLVNKFIFEASDKFKILFVLQPIFFMHIISSPRGTIFPAFWPLIKLTIIYIFIVVIIKLLRRPPHRPVSEPDPKLS